MDAEDLVRRCDHPVYERRLLQISDAVEPRGDPVLGGQHVAGDLRLDRVHIVHNVRWAGDVYEENEGSYQYYDPAVSRTSTIGMGGLASSDANSIFHRFIQ